MSAEGPSIAILCAGPSIRDLTVEDLDPFHLVIAVNRAAALLPCDDWIAQDPSILISVDPMLPPRRLITRENAYTNTRDRHSPKLVGVRVEWIEDLEARRPWLGSEKWTKILAIDLAIERGARSLAIFGDDMSGSVGCLGESEESRTAERWFDEKIATERAFQRAIASGVSSIRRPMVPRRAYGAH